MYGVAVCCGRFVSLLFNVSFFVACCGTALRYLINEWHLASFTVSLLIIRTQYSACAVQYNTIVSTDQWWPRMITVGISPVSLSRCCEWYSKFGVFVLVERDGVAERGNWKWCMNWCAVRPFRSFFFCCNSSMIQCTWYSSVCVMFEERGDVEMWRRGESNQ